MTDRQNRPPDRVYPVIFIDAIVVKVRDGQVVNRRSTATRNAPWPTCSSATRCSPTGSPSRRVSSA
jgi:hypothetical protein